MVDKCVPAIPFPSGIDRNIERMLSPIKETLDIWAGRTKDELCRVITLEDLLDSSITIQIANGISGTYQLLSEKGLADGYASLNSSVYVPAGELGSGTPDGTRFLRDDNSWQTLDADKIFEGDSSVEVIDTGTGQVDITVDASLIAQFKTSESTINGKLIIEMDTGYVYDSTTVGLIVGDSDNLDSMYFIGNTINASYGSTSDNANFCINYRGYQGGSTKYRNTIIYNGKGSAILTCIGLTRYATFSTGLQITNDLLVDGGDIGITGDTDILQLAANSLTVNGKLVVEKDTGAVYDSTTVSTIFGDSDSVDNIYMIGESINSGYGYDADDGFMLVNYRGYQGGITRFRNFNVYDGKGSLLCRHVANPKQTILYGALQVAGNIGVSGDADTMVLAANSVTVNGMIVAEKDTGGVYDPTTVSAILGDSTVGQYDSVYMIGNSINGGWGGQSDANNLYLNYRGYYGGITKFRDLYVGDGKGTVMAFFDGSAKTIDFTAIVTAKADTDTVHTLGRCAIGALPTISDYATFTHVDRQVAANYGLMVYAGGSTFLNSAPGEILYLRSNNVSIMELQTGAVAITGAVTMSSTLGLQAGTTINEFSIDGTMAGNSDDASPTEKAVVTYVAAETLHAYGEISVQDNSTPTAVSSSGWTQVTIFDTNGHSSNATPDHTNDHITIDSGFAGKYLVTISAAVANSAGVAHVIELGLHKNDGATEFTNVNAHRNLSAGSDVGSISLSGIIDVSASDTVELWATSDSGTSRNVTISDVTLSLVQIG